MTIPARAAHPFAALAFSHRQSIPERKEPQCKTES